MERSLFNKLKSPPDLKQAEIHANANRVAPVSKNSEQKRCPCCNMNTDREDLPVTCSTRDFQFIGSGYVLWFSSAVYVCILLFILFWINYQKIINNYQAGACRETLETIHPCETDWIHEYSIANFGKSFDSINIWTNVVFVILLYILVAVFKNKLYNEHKVVDLETDTPSDFTIMVQLLPKNCTEADIRQYFNTTIPEAKVAKVCMAFDVEKLEHLQKEKRHLFDQLENIKQEFYGNQKTPSLPETRPILESQKTMIDHDINIPKYKELSEVYLKKRQEVTDHIEEIENNQSKYFTGIAYISFEKMKHADLYTKMYSVTGLKWIFRCCKYKAKYQFEGVTHRLMIEPAPEATEVLWENLKYTHKQQAWKKALTSFFVVVILCITFGIIFGMKYGKNEIKHKYLGHTIKEIDHETGKEIEKYEHPLSPDEKTYLTLISISIFVVCKITNKIFDHMIEDLTEHEKHYSLGHYYSSAVTKTIVSQFVTTSVLIMIAHLIIHHEEPSVIWGFGNLISDMWYLIIFNAFVVPILHFVNFAWIKKLFQRCKVRGKQHSKVYDQDQANKIYEGPKLNIVRGYVTIYQLFLTCTFFTPALPLSPGILLGTLILVYWIEKIYVLRVYSIPSLLQEDIALENLVFIKVGAFTLFAGFAFFDYVLRFTVHPVIIVMLGVTFCMIFVPIENIFLNTYTYTGDEAEAKIDENFNSTEIKFDTDYDRLNPVTRKKAILKHIEKRNRLHLRAQLRAELTSPKDPNTEGNINGGDELSGPYQKINQSNGLPPKGKVNLDSNGNSHAEKRSSPEGGTLISNR